MPEPVLPNQPLSILSPKPQSSAILRPLQPPAQEPDEVDDSYRDFDDMVATRQAIFDRTLQAAKNIQPVSNSRHTLRLKDVDYIDDADYDYKTQKQAEKVEQTLHKYGIAAKVSVPLNVQRKHGPVNAKCVQGH
jgi:hypothetical protein